MHAQRPPGRGGLVLAGGPAKEERARSAQSAEVERRKLLANGAGLTRRCGDRLARLDHGGVGRTGAVGGDALGKANADDQRREDERYCHHLQVGKAVGGKQRKIVHDAPQQGEKKRAAGVVCFRRLVLARGLTGLLNPYVKCSTKLFQPYFMNCFDCASPPVPPRGPHSGTRRVLHLEPVG
jgi:hypothetical protein